MRKAKYIKTCYSNKKNEKPDFRKKQCYEYKGYFYYIYPDAYYIKGYELHAQHRKEQDNIDEKIKYREEHPEEFTK